MKSGTKWIVIVVGLLVGNVLAMVLLITAARIDKSQVIPEYYNKAVHYDDAIDQAAKNRQLGWTVVARWDGRVVVDVLDRDQRPMLDARVTTTARSRVPGQQRGIHDVEIIVERGGDRFVEHTTVEAK